MSFDWSAIDWGDAPTWLGALTTLAAFAAAWRLVTVELGRDRKSDELDAQRRQVEARAHQADFVAAWHGAEEMARLEMRLNGARSESKYWVRRIVFLNGSRLPVTNVEVRLLNPGDGDEIGSASRSTVPPERAYFDYTDFGFAPEELVEQDEEGYTLDVEIYGIEVVFEDTTGRRWRRDRFGRLEDLGLVRRTQGVARATATMRGTATVHQEAREGEADRA